MIAPVLLSPGSRVEIDPDVVELDPGLQARTGVLEEVVLDYAAKMRDGEVFPPITVVVVDGRNLCPDGWHRVLAARRAGVKVVADVQPGTRLQALRLAVGANEDHGAKRTNADKRRAVEIALATPELERLTDRELAKVCRVSHTYIGSLRRRSESGNVSTQPDPETSGSVTQEVAHRPTDGEIVRATLACLDHGHRGAARLPELRASVEAQLGCALEEADWRNAIARGASQRLWDHTGVISGPNLLGSITSRTKRPVTAPPAADSPIPRSAPISAGGDLEPGGDPGDPADPPRLSSASGMGAEDIDGAVQELARLLEKRQPTRVSPDTLGLTRGRLFDALGLRCLANVDWEEILDKGERGRLWVTKRKIEADGAVGGTIWLPDPTDTDTDAEQIPPSGPASAAPGASESGRAGSAPAPAAPTLFEQALAKEREHCHEESLRARSEDLRLDLEKLGGKTTLAKLRRAYEGPSKSLIRTDYWHALLGYGLESGLWVIEGERIWIEKPRISALPERLAPSLVDLRCESASHLLARLDDGEAALVIADPPWSYSQSHGASRADDHYPTLPLEDIAMHLRGAHRVGRRLALWITGALLGEWVAVRTPWGQPITAGSWVKSREGDEGHYGQGYHWAGSSELVLLYARDGSHTDRSSALRNAWIEDRGEHSCKPIGWQTQWIRRWVPEGGLVVDLYAGLASVACATLLAGGGRRYIGCEIDPARHAEALRRIEALCAKEGA